jgi:tRNA(fMet)-specific endonuclease VapC
VATRLLDTNIVSFMLKGHSLGLRYQPHLIGHTLAIAFMTAAEMYEGALRANWGQRRLAQLEAVLRGYLVIPMDPDLCRLWGVVRVQRRAQPIGVADAWIAASALRHGCDLVTHNPTDFQGITGLTIISEAP